MVLHVDNGILAQYKGLRVEYTSRIVGVKYRYTAILKKTV